MNDALKTRDIKYFYVLSGLLFAPPHKNFRLRACPLQASRQDMSRDAGKRGYCPSALWKGRQRCLFTTASQMISLSTSTWNKFIAATRPLRKFRMFFYNCLCGQHCWWTETNKIGKVSIALNTLLPLDMLMPDQEYLLRRMSMRMSAFDEARNRFDPHNFGIGDVFFVTQRTSWSTTQKWIVYSTNRVKSQNVTLGQVG